MMYREVMEREDLTRVKENIRYCKESRARIIGENIYHNIRPLLPILVVLILLFTFALFLPLKPTGFITLNKEFDYTDGVNLTVNDNYEYTWLMDNMGELKSIKLDGSISKKGSAKVYLEYNNESIV